MADADAALVARWRAAGSDVPTQQRWFADAFEHLQAAGQAGDVHWWCGHPEVTGTLVQGVLEHHDSQAVVQQLWAALSGQMDECLHCCVAFHAAQVAWCEGLAAEFRTPLLAMAQRLNEARVEAGLMRAADSAAAEELPASTVAVLFEVFSYDLLITDAGVSTALARALGALSATHELALAEGGRYRGPYRLLAHPAQHVRALVTPLVTALGPFEAPADLDTIAPLLLEWLPLLASDDAPLPAPPGGGRPRAPQPRPPLWGALAILLPLCAPVADALAELAPGLPNLVVARLVVGEPMLWQALSCLTALLRQRGRRLWAQLTLGGEDVVNRLGAVACSSREPRCRQRALQAVQAALEELQGLGCYARVRRHALHLLLHQLPSSCGNLPQSSAAALAATAEHVAYEVVLRDLQAGVPATSDMHIFGPSLCAAAASARPQPTPGPCSGTAGTPAGEHARRVHALALRVLAATLATDAAVLVRCTAGRGAANEMLAAPADRMQLTVPKPDAAADGVTVVVEGQEVQLLCQQAIENSDRWHAAPALWQELAANPQCPLGPVLVRCAALVAWVEPEAAGSSDVQQRGSGGFLLSGTLAAAPLLQAAAAWRNPHQWQPAVCDNALPVHRHAPLLLDAFRCAAAAHLTAQRHAAAVGLQLLAAAATGGGGGLLRDAVALTFGMHAGLRCAAEAWLCAATQRGTVASALAVLLDEPSGGGAAAVMGAAEEELRRLGALPLPQALSSTRAPMALGFLACVLQACADAASAASDTRDSCPQQQELPAVAWGWLCCLLQDECAALRQLSGGPALLAVLRLLAATLSAHSTCVGRLPDAGGNVLGWVLDLLRFAAHCPEGAADAWEACLAAVAAGWWRAEEPPVEVASCAAALMSGRSGTPDALKLRLASLLPSAAPGNLAQLAPRRYPAQPPGPAAPLSSLCGLPQRAAPLAAPEAQLQPGSADRTGVTRKRRAEAEGAAPRTARLRLHEREVEVIDLVRDSCEAAPKPHTQQGLSQGLLELSSSDDEAECFLGINVDPGARTAQATLTAPPLQSPAAARLSPSKRQRPLSDFFAPPNAHGATVPPRGAPAAPAPQPCKPPRKQKCRRQPASDAPHGPSAAAGGDAAPSTAQLFSVAWPQRYGGGPAMANGNMARREQDISAARLPEPDAAVARPTGKIRAALQQHLAQQPARPPPRPLVPPPRRLHAATPSIFDLGDGSGEGEEMFGGGAPKVGRGGDAGGIGGAAGTGRLAAPRRVVRLASAAVGQVNTAKWAQRRMAQATQLRPLPPPLTLDEVYAEVLSWDYDSCINGAATRPALASLGSRGVPNAFANLRQYTDAFRVLLLEELRACIGQAHEEAERGAGPDPEADASGGVLPLRLALLQRRGDLHCAEFVCLPPSGSGPGSGGSGEASGRGGGWRGKEERLGAEEIVLLTRKAPPSAGARIKPPRVHLLGIVDKVEEEAGVRTAHVSVRLLSGLGKPERLQGALTELLPSTTWHATRLLTWTTHLRQFAALCAATTLPAQLLQAILSPQAPPNAQHGLTLATLALPRGLTATLESSFNPSQQAAIARAAGGTAAFTLVQGPPGTGKTAAILGMLSALLAGNTAPPLLPQLPRGDGDRSSGPAAPGAPSARVTTASEKGKGGKKGGKGEAGVDLGSRQFDFAHVPSKRVLVAAQSNAAIDELVARVAVQGLFSPGGGRRNVSMARMGMVTSAHTSVLAYHIDALAQQFAERDERIAASSAEADEQRARLAEVRRQLTDVRKQIQEADERRTGRGAKAADDEADGSSSREATPEEGGDSDDTPALNGGERGSVRCTADNLDALHDARRRLTLEQSRLTTAVRGRGEALRRQRREVRQGVVRWSEVVACTLVSAGGDLLSLCANGGPKFDAIIIDEAAQALEPASLIPLQLLSPGGRVVLVGDPKQLPATVISRKAQAAHLSRSLFERLERLRHPVCLLAEQYRMHPSISKWPSDFFYGGRIVDGAAVGAQGRQRHAPFHRRPAFQPLAFYDCCEGREAAGENSGSLTNSAEVSLAAELYKALHRDFAGQTGSVAVLSPYKAQVTALRRMFRVSLPEAALVGVEFATVDGFQGREADVVLFSCVRARGRSAVGGVGFLADVRRMNVALTRARRALWVIGHARTLQSCPPWKALLDNCLSRGRLFVARRPFEAIPAARQREDLLPPAQRQKLLAKNLGSKAP